MNVIMVIIAFAVALASAAWLTARMRRARRAQEIADEAAIHDLYDRYLTDVEALTQAYLLQAPSDEEWLAKIRLPTRAPGRLPQAERLPLRGVERTLHQCPECSPMLIGRPHRPRSLEMLVIGVVVTASLALSLPGQAHVSMWWVLLSAAVALGAVVGKVIGSVVHGGQLEEDDRGRIRTPQRVHDDHSPR